jgi:putative flippase GtrA
VAPAAVLRTRANGWRSFGRFAVVGISGCGVQIVLFALLVGQLACNPRIAAIVATAVALGGNFVLHRIWSFEARDGHMGGQAWRFVVVSIGAIGGNVLVLSTLTALGAPEVESELVAICLQAPLSYLGNRHWAFADQG